MAVRVANETVLKDGTVDRGSSAIMVGGMDELLAADWPVTIYDLDGESLAVKPIPMAANVPWREPLKVEKGRVIEWKYNLLLERVPLS